MERKLEIDYDKLAEVMLAKMAEGKNNPPAPVKANTQADTRPAPVALKINQTFTLSQVSTKTKMPAGNFDVTGEDGAVYFVHIVKRKQ